MEQGSALEGKSATGYPLTEREEERTALSTGEKTAGCYSSWFYAWMHEIMVTGYGREIAMEDLPYIAPELKAEALVKRFHQANKPSPTQKSPRGLAAIMFTMTAGELSMAAVYMLVYVFCQVGQPLLLRFLILSVREDDANGIYYVVGLFCCQFFGALVNQRHFHIMFKVGQKLRGVVIALVFDKALKLRLSLMGGWTMGSIVNLISNDSQKYFDLMPQFHLLWAAPLQIGITSYFLISQLGVAALAGIGMLVLITPLNTCLARFLDFYRRKHIPLMDRRLKTCTETLGGMRIVKLFSWESSFLENIFSLRDVEDYYILREMIVFAIQIFLMIIVVSLAMASTFGAYVLAGNKMDAATVFSSLAFFNVLRFPLMYMGSNIMTGVQALISTKRINSFLHLRESRDSDPIPNPHQKHDLPLKKIPRKLSEDAQKIPKDHKLHIISKRDSHAFSSVLSLGEGDRTSSHMMRAGSLSRGVMAGDGGSRVERGERLETVGGVFAWREEDRERKNVGKESSSFILSDVDITVRKGELAVVIGEVGAGKSTLVNSILGETVNLGGHMVVPKPIAYAAQQAWILGATVRENIVFNSAFDNDWYQTVLRACALIEDLKTFSHGDGTVVGERGVTLSGGQQARISLARAVYAKKPLLIADDPLSALDAHTGKHIFNKVFAEGGIARRYGGVLLVTHATQYLSECKKVYFLHKGKVAICASYSELQLIFTEENRDSKALPEALKTALRQFVNRPTEGKTDQTEDPSGTQEKKINSVKSTSSESGVTGTGKGKLHTDEDRAQGTVALGVYIGYFKAAGGLKFAFCLLSSLLLERLTYLGADWWLTRWIQASDGGGGTFGLGSVDNQTSNNNYLGVYILWVLGNSIFALLRMLVFSFGAASAAARLFRDMARAVFRSPMRFFETTPLGRITNRFSYDTEVLDFGILEKLNGTIASSFWLMSSVTVIIAVQPIMSGVICIVLFLYYKLQLYYRKTSVQIQRLDSISRSPIQAHFAETLQGAVTIRSFENQTDFTNVMMSHIDSNARAVLAYSAASRWLGVRLETLGALVTAATGLLCWIYRDQISGELTGLALLWSFNFTISLNFLVNKSTEAESKMNSAERMLHYSRLPPEV
ncbi:hypothetical protein AAMO2058_000300900 [Amorphochlora amoebiformis]